MGFMVHERGIEVGQKSIKAIDEVVPPTTKIELQSLLGKIDSSEDSFQICQKGSYRFLPC